MELSELPGYLKGLQKAASLAVAPAATGMASAVKNRIQNDTLRQAVHPPYTFYRAVAGRPPAYASGNLARSIIMTPASGAIAATASVGATARYAAIQEWGGWTVPNKGMYMHWRNPRPWWRKRVVIPEHPYFRPTVENMIRDGSLSRSAYVPFWNRIAFFFRA
jgi:phage gpG-like protein